MFRFLCEFRLISLVRFQYCSWSRYLLLGVDEAVHIYELIHSKSQVFTNSQKTIYLDNDRKLSGRWIGEHAKGNGELLFATCGREHEEQKRVFYERRRYRPNETQDQRPREVEVILACSQS